MTSLFVFGLVYALAGELEYIDQALYDLALTPRSRDSILSLEQSHLLQITCMHAKGQLRNKLDEAARRFPSNRCLAEIPPFYASSDDLDQAGVKHRRECYLGLKGSTLDHLAHKFKYLIDILQFNFLFFFEVDLLFILRRLAFALLGVQAQLFKNYAELQMDPFIQENLLKNLPRRQKLIEHWRKMQ